MHSLVKIIHAATTLLVATGLSAASGTPPTPSSPLKKLSSHQKNTMINALIKKDQKVIAIGNEIETLNKTLRNKQEELATLTNKPSDKDQQSAAAKSTGATESNPTTTTTTATEQKKALETDINTLSTELSQKTDTFANALSEAKKEAVRHYVNIPTYSLRETAIHKSKKYTLFAWELIKANPKYTIMASVTATLLAVVYLTQGDHNNDEDEE